MSEIKEFLENKRELKQIVKLTKETDSIYLEKRNVLEVYNSETPYDFLTWKDTFNKDIRKRYESLHQSLLYTNEQQDFDIAVQVFEEINERLDLINE